MTIVSRSSTAELDSSRVSPESSLAYVETLTSSMESLSAYVQRWNDVRGAVYSENTDRGLYRLPVRASRLENEPRPKYVPSDSSDYSLSHRVSEKLKNLYAADAVATFDPAQSRVAIRIAVDAVEEAIEDGDLASLNELLSSADAQSLRKITSIALLRTSFRVRNKVGKWNRFYSEVYAHLSRTEQDPQHALRGMVKG